MSSHAAEQQTPAALTRLAALAFLDVDARRALASALQRPRAFRIRRELLAEGSEILEPLLILGGWAARVRILEDGRRQILNFLLPGDLIGLCEETRSFSSSSVIAITDVQACAAPRIAASSTLALAYAKSRAIEDTYLLAQITRLGRFNAQERIADLLLELVERLELCGLATGGRYAMPITQEVIADALGLTSVHVNRTLQALRRDGLVLWKGRQVFLPRPDILRRMVGRRSAHVAAD